jgi:hypothetical protein
MNIIVVVCVENLFRIQKGLYVLIVTGYKHKNTKVKLQTDIKMSQAILLNFFIENKGLSFSYEDLEILFPKINKLTLRIFVNKLCKKYYLTREKVLIIEGRKGTFPYRNYYKLSETFK